MMEEAGMHPKWKTETAVILCLAACLASALFYSIQKTGMQLSAEHYELTEMSMGFYLIWSLLALLFAACAWKRPFAKIWYALVALLGIVLIVGDTSFSPIDEASHLDYVNCILEEHRLPTMYEYGDTELLKQVNSEDTFVRIRRYEAVQVPLYYLLMAALTGPFSDPFTRFLIIRFFGLACLAGVLFFSEKSITLLRKKGLIAVTDTHANIVISLFALNPGILVRFVRISNESLAVLLAAAVSCLAVKLLADGFSLRLWIAGIVMSILLFYTKSTGALCIGAILLMLLYYKKWVYFILSAAVYTAAAVPWFWRCKKLYGTLTGMNEHMNIVLPIVNPDKNRVNFMTGMFELFSRGFFTPAELDHLSAFALGMTHAVNVLLFFMIAGSVLWSVRQLYFLIAGGLHFTYTDGEKKKVLVLCASAVIACHMLFLAVPTQSAYIDTLTGRYAYFILIPLAILVLKLMEGMRYKNGLAAGFVVFYAVLYVHTLARYTDTIGIRQNAWGEDRTIEASEYIRNDEGEVLGMKLKGVFSDMDRLVHRTVLTGGGENALVADARPDTDGMTQVLFEDPIEPEADDKTVRLAKESENIREYNSGGMQLLEHAGKNTLQQSFLWDGGDIHEIMLMTANYMQTQHGRICVKLLDQTMQPAGRAGIRMEQCPDNDWVSVKFCDLENLEEGRYYIEITMSEDEDGGEIVLYTGDDDSYADGTLRIDGMPSGKDLNFKIGS